MGFVARGIREVGGGALQRGLGRLDGVGELREVGSKGGSEKWEGVGRCEGYFSNLGGYGVRG